ncbi:hypothetical protein EDB84DRAFT_133019 [Lactarius hengduanensis]|nr:hypothetical protein EDB84DRAFT_133019 [Lactarius hengduanensis]
MPWAKTILSQFQMVSKNPSRAEFHGPYNKILYSLFPADTDFTVFPRFVPDRDSAPLRRFGYEVRLDDRPVFLLELKRPGDLRYSLKRREADQEIRESMEVLRVHLGLDSASIRCMTRTISPSSALIPYSFPSQGCDRYSTTGMLGH